MTTNQIIIIVSIALLILIVVSIYNKLVRLRVNRENAFADIDVQLKQRHDLIPQLVESVRGYMKHEEKVLVNVTAARSGAMNAQGIDAKIAAENNLTSALQGLKIAVEAYPELKANTNFLQLQSEISDVENKLAAVRRYFNSSTKELNISVQSFPSNIIAKLFGFKKESMFDVGEEAREKLDVAPKISFE